MSSTAVFQAYIIRNDKQLEPQAWKNHGYSRKRLSGTRGTDMEKGPGNVRNGAGDSG
jgi:hypothetical protein